MVFDNQKNLAEKIEYLEKERKRIYEEYRNLEGIITVLKYFSVIIFLSLIYNIIFSSSIFEAIDTTAKHDGLICVFIFSICGIIVIFKWLLSLK